jgi:hypothetical protein
MAYAKPKPGSKLVKTSERSAKQIWDADKGKLYVNTDGTKTVYYPDGSTCNYPGK